MLTLCGMILQQYFYSENISWDAQQNHNIKCQIKVNKAKLAEAIHAISASKCTFQS